MSILLIKHTTMYEFNDELYNLWIFFCLIKKKLLHALNLLHSIILKNLAFRLKTSQFMNK